MDMLSMGTASLAPGEEGELEAWVPTGYLAYQMVVTFPEQDKAPVGLAISPPRPAGTRILFPMTNSGRASITVAAHLCLSPAGHA